MMVSDTMVLLMVEDGDYVMLALMVSHGGSGAVLQRS